MSVQHSAGSSGQGVPRVSRKVQTRIMLDAIVSNKTIGNATFRQFVIRGFQNFKRLAFRRMFFGKKVRPLKALRSDQEWCLRSAVAIPLVSPIPMPNGTIFREISEPYRWIMGGFFRPRAISLPQALATSHILRPFRAGLMESPKLTCTPSR